MTFMNITNTAEEEVIFFEEDETQESQSDSYVHDNSELAEIKKIVVAATDWTTATIRDQILRENIQLNPRFQRRDGWDITRKSRFIESLILGLPIPQIILAAQRERGKFIVLDGKHRLLTILQFYGDSATPNNAFALKKLEFITDMNGKSYEDLRSNIFLKKELDALDNQTIRIIVLRNVNNENLLYKIFMRLNVQSSFLSTQELRQALHPGDFINFLDDHSIKSESLKKIFKSPNPDFRMRDVELLLRYLGFHFFIAEYRGNLKVFLDMTCQKMNEDWKQKHNDIQNAVDKFEKAVQTTINIFGEKNFARMWLEDKNTYKINLNIAILDVMVFYFSDEIIRGYAEEQPRNIEDAFKQLCSSNIEFRESVKNRTTNIRETYNRLRLWGETLLQVLDVELKLPELIDNHIVFNGLR